MWFFYWTWGSVWYRHARQYTLKTLALSSSSEPPSVCSQGTNTNRGGRSGTLSLSILFLYDLSMIPKFIILILFFLCFLWKFSWTEGFNFLSVKFDALLNIIRKYSNLNWFSCRRIKWVLKAVIISCLNSFFFFFFGLLLLRTRWTAQVHICNGKVW